MKGQSLYQLFVDELKDMFSAENLLVEFLPKLIKAATFPDLKEALSSHLKETQHQTHRIEKIFSILGIPAKEKPCRAMQGLIKEGEELVASFSKSAVLDAAIISACQKVEHYEIASYGTLISFAKYLDFDSDIKDLLQDTLDEEGSANKKLTKIAEGTLFTSGVNKEALEATSKR